MGLTMTTIHSCTCRHLDDPWAHEVHCQLWDSSEFSEGTARWDPVDRKLVATRLDEVPPEEWFVLATQACGDAAPKRSDFTQEVIDDDLVEGSPCTHDRVHCAECGVFRHDDGRWLLTAEKLFDLPGNDDFDIDDVIDQWEAEEKAMQRQGKPLTCVHQHSYLCVKCGVVRDKLGDPWREYAGPKVGEQVMASKATASTPAPPSWSSIWDDGYGWGGVTGGGATTTYVKDRHYGDKVTFPDGTTIVASSAHVRSDKDKEEDKARGALPDFGVYFASSWSPDWLAYYINWPDGDLPKVPIDQVIFAAEQVRTLANNGGVVEIGCIGGHGRTGTFMACLATLCGVPAAEACDWVWKNYCDKAIETARQEWYVEYFDAARTNTLDQLRECPPKPVYTYTKTTVTPQNSNHSIEDHRQLFLQGLVCIDKIKKDGSKCNWWDKDVEAHPEWARQKAEADAKKAATKGGSKSAPKAPQGQQAQAPASTSPTSAMTELDVQDKMLAWGMFY